MARMLQTRGDVLKGAQISLDVGVCVVGLDFAKVCDGG